MQNLSFEAVCNTSEHSSNSNFCLHSHDSYELFLFLEGDSKFIVEGNSYSLKPYDIIVVKKHQMHRAFHNSNTRYKRFVINVYHEFFEKNNCPEYEEQLMKICDGNKISSAIVLSNGIYDAFCRLREYTDDLKNLDTPIAYSIVTEILYLISKTENFNDADTGHKQLSQIINYINANFSESITLDMLEKRFFISKYHLCHIFRNETGMTVHQYITRKRIGLVKDLVQGGKSISEASTLAGFNSYSSFYRAYKQECQKSPKSDIIIH